MVIILWLSYYIYNIPIVDLSSSYSDGHLVGPSLIAPQAVPLCQGHGWAQSSATLSGNFKHSKSPKNSGWIRNQKQHSKQHTKQLSKQHSRWFYFRFSYDILGTTYLLKPQNIGWKLRSFTAEAIKRTPEKATKTISVSKSDSLSDSFVTPRKSWKSHYSICCVHFP